MITERSIMRSFVNVKKDIRKIQANLLEISAKQVEFYRMITELRNSLDKSAEKKPSSRKKR
jgi:hypothetical protein